MVVPGRFTKLTPKNKKKFLQRTFNEKNEFTELINFLPNDHVFAVYNPFYSVCGL